MDLIDLMDLTGVLTGLADLVAQPPNWIGQQEPSMTLLGHPAVV